MQLIDGKEVANFKKSAIEITISIIIIKISVIYNNEKCFPSIFTEGLSEK